MAANHLIVFHGTGQNVTKFTEEDIGRGGDQNAALGVHATACPEEAREYAEMSVEPGEDMDSGRVLVLWYPYDKEANMFSNNEFFGIDEHGDSEVDDDHFPAMRQQYLADGYDVITVEYGEEPIFVLLNPEKIKILGSLTLDQAGELSECLLKNKVDRFDSEALYKEYQSVLGYKRHPVDTPSIS